MIEKVLASGPEALVKDTSLELVEEALEFLCTRPLSHLVEAPRLEVINKFAGDFDAIVQKVLASITAKDEYERVKDSHSQLVTRSQQILEEIKEYNADKEASDQEMVEVRKGLRKLKLSCCGRRLKTTIESLRRMLRRYPPKPRTLWQEEAQGLVGQIQDHREK